MRLVPGLLLCLGILLSLSLNHSGVIGHDLQTSGFYDAPVPVAANPHGEPGALSFADNGRPAAAFTSNADEAALFERLTAQNIGRRLALLLDDLVLTAPVVQDKINGGKLVVAGNFTFTEAAYRLVPHAASLPLPLTMLESRILAPATGKGVGS